MSNEQNIDDILKLLKSSVSDDSSSEQVHISEDKPDDMNDEVLKRLEMLDKVWDDYQVYGSDELNQIEEEVVIKENEDI